MLESRKLYNKLEKYFEGKGKPYIELLSADKLNLNKYNYDSIELGHINYYSDIINKFIKEVQ